MGGQKKRETDGTVWLSYLNFCLVKACQHQLFYSFAQNTDGALTTLANNFMSAAPRRAKSVH